MLNRTKFISFTDGYEYNHSSKMFVSAAQRLNKWLEANHKVEIVNWHICNTGADNYTCIVAEYREVTNSENL